MDSSVPRSEETINFRFRIRFTLFLRWLIFSLILFGVPIVIAWKGLEEIAREQQASLRLEQERTLDAALSTIERWKNPKLFFEMLMDRLRERIFFTKNPKILETAFKRYSRFLKRKFPEVLEFTFLDSEGNAIQKLCDRVPPRKLLKKFFADLVIFQNETDSELRKNWNLYRAFFGSMIEEPNNRLFRKMTEANNSAKHAYVYVANHATIQKRGMFIAHFNLNQQWEQMITGYCVDLFQHRNRQKDFQLFLL